MSTIEKFLIRGYATDVYWVNYIDSHNRKIDILHDLLSAKFGINRKEKVDELIGLYQAYIDKKNEEEKRHERVIFALFTALTGILSISFTNMDTIGIDFRSWLYIAICVLIYFSCIGIGILSYNFFDSIKKKYEMMILDLKDLLLRKY